MVFLPLLVEIGTLVVVLWVLAIVLLIAVILGYIAGKLHGLPFPLNQLAGPVNSLSKGIADVCYHAIHKAEQLLGSSLHLMARFITATWDEFKRHGIAILEAATIIGALVHAVHILKALVRRLEHTRSGTSAAIRTLTREYHGIEHRVRDLERKITRGIGHDLRIRIKALERFEKRAERAIDHTIPEAIAGAEGQLADLKRWLGVRVNTNYKDWVAGLVLAGLAALGLSGLNCKNLKDPLAKRGCAYWDDLAALLGLATIAIEAANFEELVREAQSLEHGVAVAIKELWGLP